MKTILAAFLILVALGVSETHADDCAKIKAFNAQQPSRAGMKMLPCHCIPLSEREDKVYDKPPPGWTCGNHAFYDKKCHAGLTCFPN